MAKVTYEFPVKYFEENLIFDSSSKDCWACFKVQGFNYDFLSSDKKILLLNRLTRFIAAVGGEFKILVIPIAQDIDSHYENLVSGLDKKSDLYRYGKQHAEGTRAYLREKIRQEGTSNDYAVYLLTRLSVTKSISQLVDSLIRRPKKTVEEFFRVDYKEILASEIRVFMEESEAFYRDQNKRVRLEKTDTDTTQWLIRRMFRRGIPEEVKIRKNKSDRPWTPYKMETLKDGEKALRPHERDILSLTEAKVEPGSKYIKITNSDGKVSYQNFLTISHIPDGLVFPGSEWLLVLQDYPVETEVCLHIKPVEFKDSLKKISGKKREIKSQTEHVAENDEVPDELYEAKENADGLEAELKSSRDPLLMMSASICIAADNVEEMAAKTEFIKSRYEDYNFMIENPRTDQYKLFMEFIPGAGRYVSDYIIPLPPRTAAGSMFAATRMLGDNTGPYIGTTGVQEKMVFLALKLACLMNRSASAAFLGTLGGGKSFNANLMMYLNIIYGGYGLIFDPKGERSSWPEMIPELADCTSIITLSSGEEDVGKLDPFIIYRDDPNAAGELAQNILCELFKVNPKDDEFTVILTAIQHVKKMIKPSMSALADQLNNFPEDDELRDVAKHMGRRVSLIREAGMAKLLFGTGDEKGLQIQNRLNILQIQNLVMPEPTTPKEDYTQEEVISTVLMLPIASFGHKFAKFDRSVFKLILFDESWALTATQMGKKMMNALARLGRSLNAGCIFIGHSVNDLAGEGIKNAITYKFCFKTTEINEIKRVLAFLDLEETDENISEVRNLRNGECLFQDLDGRVGKLRFDAVYEHLIKAFNTTPVDVNMEKEGA